jgi:TM2 domain-containing membrane protein YozV
MNTAANPHMLYCRACGSQMHVSAHACPGCGAAHQNQSQDASLSQKRILPAAILCFFLGFLGVHRFYVGKVGTGILQVLTFGGFGIWALIDFIMIVVGSFSDSEGNVINLWT